MFKLGGRWAVTSVLIVLLAGGAALSYINGWREATAILILLTLVVFLILVTQIVVLSGNYVRSIRKAIRQSQSNNDLRHHQLAAAIDRNDLSVKSLNQLAGKSVQLAQGKIPNSALAGLLKRSVAGYTVEHEFARRWNDGAGHLVSFALNSRSLAIRDVFALSASYGRWDMRGLIEFVRLANASYMKLSDIKFHTENLNSIAIVRIAVILANQQQLPSDSADSHQLFEFVRRTWGVRAIPKRDRYFALEMALIDANYEGAAEKVGVYGLSRNSVHRSLMMANEIAANGLTADTSQDWCDIVSTVLETDGLEPISLLEDAGLPSKFDRLDSYVAEKILTGPMVTILVPTFGADARMNTAIRGLLSQTWQNLEIVIVDDGSDQRTVDFLRSFEKVDPRIKVIPMGSNRGAYIARNVGLENSHGEFITVHDDDDWSHPRKIERQVRDLIEHPEKVGNMSAHVRTTEDLIFTRINVNPQVVQGNYSSLMFRRDILAKSGPWQSVNRAGDSEFKERLEAISGTKIGLASNVPTSFTRTGGNSLTKGELSRGFVDSARRFYMQSFQYAQRQRTSVDDWISYGASLPSGVPENLKDGQRHGKLGHFDIVYGTDFHFPGGNTTLALSEIGALVERGKSVGIVQLDSPVNSITKPFPDKVFEFLEKYDGRISVLSLRDTIDVSLLILRHPTVTQYIDGLTSNFKVEKVALIANSTPVLSDGTGRVYSLSDSASNIRKLFDKQPRVYAESDLTRNLCEIVGEGALLERQLWPGIIDTEVFSPAASKSIGIGKPIIGRHSRDSVLKWPDADADLKTIYIGSGFDTRILGGVESVAPRLTTQERNSITVYEFGTMAAQDFLSELDFWVYFPSERQVESFGMATLEALACGLVVILPYNMESTFGEAAIYTTPSQVPAVVQKYWNDPVLYKEQSHAARRFVVENYSEESLLNRVNLIDSGEE